MLTILAYVATFVLGVVIGVIGIFCFGIYIISESPYLRQATEPKSTFDKKSSVFDKK